MACDKCKDEKYYKKDGMWIACDCHKFIAMKNVINSQVGEFLPNRELLDFLKKKVKQPKTDNTVLYLDVGDTRLINWAVSLFWTDSGFDSSFRMIEIKDIINIFVRDVPETETCKSLRDLAQYKFLAIYVGMYEHPNGSLPNLVAQLIDSRKMQDYSTWVFVKGIRLPAFSRYFYDKKTGTRKDVGTVNDVDLNEYFNISGFQSFWYPKDAAPGLDDKPVGCISSDPCAR